MCFKTRLDHLRNQELDLYEQAIKGEDVSIENLNTELQDTVFDYFNIIEKEYSVSRDLIKDDPDYVKLLEDSVEEINQKYNPEDKSLDEGTDPNSI